MVNYSSYFVINRNNKYKNVITETGREEMTKRIGCGSSQLPFTYIAIGAGNTSATVSDTSLENELCRAESTYDYQSSYFSETTAFAPTSGTGAITELGIFNSSGPNTGTMLARCVFESYNKVSSKALLVEWRMNII